jgi:hypothetical protein
MSVHTVPGAFKYDGDVPPWIQYIHQQCGRVVTSVHNASKFRVDAVSLLRTFPI